MAKSETAQIAQLDKIIKSLDDNVKTLSNDFETFNKKLSNVNASNVNLLKTEYQSLQKRVEDLGKSQERTAKSVDEQIQKVSRSRRVDNKILERQNQLLAAQKRLASTGDLGQRFSSLKNSLGNIDFNSILATANAKTGRQEILQESSSRLKKAQQDYKNAVDKTTNSIKQQKSSLESMLPTLRRLASAFGVAFSVQGLVQFGRKLIETRGEFEMQFVAMKSIIGDVDAATKIWNQTLQQSLQSPKTFKELTTYTKQLAAYRIETEKLFDTTKRLADVSAGLGVDMGRLILAYGQVKAANYLRASEVRQFTEAGVNIYGELAKYFSEIEGRAVGTAEVVERVSKRMVLFSDVEKIFQRMTDEGGTFFNMQEIQADTVLGQINKLHDAYDQMLNTIGQANQGTIRNLLETLNDLVRNWQNVAFVLKGNVNWITLIGAALYALSRNYLKGATTQTLWFSKAIMGNSKVLLKDTADIKIFSKVIGDYSLKTRVAVVATRTLQGALSKLGNVARAIWPLVVFEGAVLLIERLTRASRELKRFREELEAVTSENVGRMNEEISGYDALIKKLQKTNEGTAARKEILDEISNKYGKYLDFIVTEKTTVDELAGAYDNVVSSIRNYTAEKIREEQQQKLEKGIYDEYQDLVNSLTNKRITDEQGNQFKITKEQAKNIAKLIQQSLDKYGVVDIQSILETYFGKALGLTGAGGGNASIGNIIREYIGEYSSLNQELQNIRNDIEGQTPVFSSDAEYNDYKKRVQDANAALAEQAKKNEQIINEIKNKERAESDSWKIEDEISAQRIKNSEEELRIRKQYGLITEQQYKDALKRLHGELDSYETDYNERLAKSLSDQYGKTWKTSNKEARDMYNYVVSTEDALQQGTLQRNKQLVESYKGLKESLKEYKEQLSAAQKTGAGEDAIKKIQGDIDWATLMMKAIELAAQLRGLDLTDKKKGRTAHNYDSISSLISLLKEMNSEYDKLSKSAYGFAKSNEKVVESFTPAFKEIFGFAGIDILQVDTTSKRATADAMKLVIDTLDKKNLWGKFGSDGGKKARKEFIKAWSQEDVEADIDVQVRIREDFGRQMEEAFGNYELTLDLQKLNLPDDVLKDLFDIDAIDTPALRKELDRLYESLKDKNGEVAEDSFKVYENWLKKIDDSEQKAQRERLKNYSKYLEYQVSERAKIEMEYARKVAEVQAESAFGGKNEQLRSRILDGLKREYNEKIAKQDWEDFKGSEMYIQMMEDLTKQGTASLEIMRKKLIEVRDNAENLSPRALKEVINAIEKIDDEFYNRQSPFARIGKYRKELMEAMSAAEYDNISGVFADDAAAKEDYENARKLHETYENIIGDKTTLADVTKKLKDITDEYNITGKTEAERIEDAKMQLETYRQAKKRDLRARNELGGRTKDTASAFDLYTGNINAANAAIASLEKYIELTTEYTTLTEKLKGTKYENVSIEELSRLSKEQLDSMGWSEDEQKRLGNIINLWRRYNKAVSDGLAELSDYVSRIGSLYDDITGNLNALGVSTDVLDEQLLSSAKTAISSIKTIIDALKEYKDATKEAVDNGKNLLEAGSTGDYIRLALALLKVLIDVAAQIGLIKDAAYEKQIQQQQLRIDALKDAYARLEKQIEKTWSSVSYIQTYEQQMQNIRDQIEAMESQMAAERAKKNTDENAVLQYQRDIQDAYDQLDELQQKSIEVFGGIGEEGYRSAAEGFVEAWKSAFLETGDGLQALQDHFDEFLQDWFVKQATMRIAGGMLEPLFRQIDYAVDRYSMGGTDAMLAEIENVRNMAAAIFPDLSLALENLAGMFGVGGEGSLSGLAAGIQGMTEEQANILEAYWNSVRMYTASIDMNVARIAEMLGVGGPSSNPLLQQMSLIAANTQATHQLLQSVTKSGHSQGGYGIKVFND